MTLVVFSEICKSPLVAMPTWPSPLQDLLWLVDELVAWAELKYNTSFLHKPVSYYIKQKGILF